MPVANPMILSAEKNLFLIRLRQAVRRRLRSISEGFGCTRQQNAALRYKDSFKIKRLQIFARNYLNCLINVLKTILGGISGLSAEVITQAGYPLYSARTHSLPLRGVASIQAAGERKN